MADEKNFVLDANQELGEIVIAPEVIEVIIGIAASNVEGVYRMQGNFANGVTELLGRSTYGKGVYLTMDEDGIKVDIYTYMKYGVSVPKVAMDIQNRVKEQVLFMTDVELAEVNIHVVAVVPVKNGAIECRRVFLKMMRKKMSKELARHEIRKKAVQALFPLDVNQALEKTNAITAALELEQDEMVDDEQEHFVPEYLDFLVTGVCDKKRST
ncbi:alkaline shock protein [Tetragenococcus muriaticus PMC-11-5]|uniref:Alkaline shock protein n=1 Tax=Tetragenococcus muriaticus PMC-11-5 TaxID=1302649 RepID=A0A091C8Z1_9ENTE|nr:alkaline shock protein [Tetragenococcus muriaticus PMC-11-5]